jgi:hypothetical protein
MTNPRWVDFVSDLLTINNTATEAVIVRNHSAENDGGGVFCWMTGTATSNNGTIDEHTGKERRLQCVDHGGAECGR